MYGQKIIYLIISIGVAVYSIILLKEYFYNNSFIHAHFKSEKPRDFYVAAINLYLKDKPTPPTGKIVIMNILLLIFIPTGFLMRLFITECTVGLAALLGRKKANDSMQENIDKHYKNVKITNLNHIDTDNYYKILVTILDDNNTVLDAQRLLDFIDLIVDNFKENQYNKLLNALINRATQYAQGAIIFKQMLNPYDTDTYKYLNINSRLAKRLLYVCNCSFEEFTMRFRSLLDDKEYTDIKKSRGYNKPDEKAALSQEKSKSDAIEGVIGKVSIIKPDLSGYSDEEKQCIEIVGLKDYIAIKEQHIEEFGEQEWQKFKRVFISECMGTAAESLEKIKEVKSIYICIFPYWDMPNDMKTANKYFGAFLLALNKLDNDYKEIMEYTEKARQKRNVTIYKKSVWLNPLQDISHNNQDFEQLRQMIEEKGDEINIIYNSKQVFRAVHFDGPSGNRTYCIVYFHI